MASDRYLAVLSFEFWVLSFGCRSDLRLPCARWGSASVRQSDLRFEI